MIDDLLKSVVRHDGQAIHCRDSHPLAVGQAQPPADGLFHQGPGVRGPQGDDGIEIRNVPSLFEHIDVDDDLDRVVPVFNVQQLLDDLVFLFAAHVRVDGNHLAFVSSLEESVIFHNLLQRIGVGCILGDNQHKRLDDRLVVVSSVHLQFNFRVFMNPHAVFELDLLQAFVRVVRGIEVLPRRHRRLLYEAIVHRTAQGITVNHVPERLGALALLHLRRGGQLQPQDGIQLVDRPHSGAGPVAMRFIHQHHQVVQPGEVIEIALPDVLAQALDARALTAAYFAVDLRDVEDVYMDLAHIKEPAATDAAPTLIIIAGDDLRRVDRELGDALKNILRRVRRKIGK